MRDYGKFETAMVNGFVMEYFAEVSFWKVSV
jgi:hypothetical protein